MITAGYKAHATTTGQAANATTAGDWANATTTGDEAHATTTGDAANATTTGRWANATTTGYKAHATTTGDAANATTTGDAAVACALGMGAIAKAGPQGTIVLTWVDGLRSRVVVGYPGEDGILANMWYSCVAGTLVAHPEILLPDDGRGFMLIYRDGRYRAGCRDFTAAEAVEHWSNPDHEAPASAARLLAAVQANENRITEG